MGLRFRVLGSRVKGLHHRPELREIRGGERHPRQNAPCFAIQEVSIQKTKGNTCETKLSMNQSDGHALSGRPRRSVRFGEVKVTPDRIPPAPGFGVKGLKLEVMD